MKVRLVYRNYKSLHRIHRSLVDDPPAGVEYLLPKPSKLVSRFVFLHRHFRELPLGKSLIRLAEKLFFVRKASGDKADLYHYINIIDRDPPNLPYVVDVEHVAGLSNFVPDPGKKPEILRFLQNPNCKAIFCLSNAAKKTLEEYFDDGEYQSIKGKIHVVYPALKPAEAYGYKAKYVYLKNSSDKLQVLFVGNQCYLKGLEELLKAVQTLNQQGGGAIDLTVISADAKEVVDKYALPNARLLEPNFSTKEIAEQFFIPADLYILPTKEDTFGMAILDSLSCGTPVVATDQFAIPELVDDKVDGLLMRVPSSLLSKVVIPSKADMDSVTKPNFNKVLYAELAKTLTYCVANRAELAKMAFAGKNKFKSGHQFSIERRNQAIVEVYQTAVKASAPRR